MDKPVTLKNNNFLMKYTATESLSNEHFSNAVSHRRHLAGKNREAIAQRLEISSPSNYHYSLFTDSEKVFVAKHGNFNYLHSTEVLRKVKSQHLGKSRFDCEPWQDII